MAISVNRADLRGAILASASGQVLIKLIIQNNGSTTTSVAVIKDYQVDPVRRDLLHADFYVVDLSKPLQVEVGVHLIGRPMGAERGGILQEVRREVLVSALPQDLPQYIEVDVSGLNLGESLNVRDLPVPPGVEILTDASYTIAAVVAPRGVAEEVTGEELVEGEAAEGEEAGEEAESAEEEDS
jgi:large subunit ribosomal protein L25